METEKEELTEQINELEENNHSLESEIDKLKGN
ncbi:cell division protein FtsB [Cytobacillus purgationiresistens]|uniref:Cell division protein FtsB n=1 Tax=Cytobacillus purgationiresistens TaxID=863449 RepID=A0ABU0AS04_9BACI|nr:cell division protein FtsB [Cytobacillus purgationiresistens]